MRILFMGTPEFAVPSLQILLEHGYNVVSVVTAPDKPQGRGQRVGSTPVKEVALLRGIPLLQPSNLKAPEFVSAVSKLQPDLIIVVAFRILPPEVFRIPRLGSFNLHASLLPKFRGAAPIQWAILRGETETGVTTFFLQEKVDTGTILLQARVRIGQDETAGELHDRLADLGAQVVLQTVRAIEMGSVKPQVQDESQSTSAPKIFKEDCEINWTRPSVEIHNFVRGLSPAPCAWTKHKGRILRIYRTSVLELSEPLSREDAGKIVELDERHVLVGTGDGIVAIEEVQHEGRKRMGIAEFLRGYSLRVDDKFGAK